MTRLFLIAFVSCAAFSAPARVQDFHYRGWVGARLANDKDGGCAMGLNVRREAGFVVYANARRAFKIGIGSVGWKLEEGKEAIAAITFDDSPPLLLKGAAVSPTTVLFEPMDFRGEGGLEPLVEGARSIKMTYAGQFLKARLSGSSRAIKMLWECAAAPEPPLAARGTDVVGEGAPAADERSAEFGFLRQGMDGGDANAKLLDAGWQTQAEPAGSGEIDPDPALKGLRARGVPVQSCTGAPPSCVVDYADAYGNALRVTVAGDGASKVRSWRLNPPDAPKRDDEADDQDAPPKEDRNR